MHAVARLVLDPVITNIQASWVKMGPDGAALCLDAGCNDMGGVLMDELITRAAGAVHGQEVSAARDGPADPRPRPPPAPAQHALWAGAEWASAERTRAHGAAAGGRVALPARGWFTMSKSVPTCTAGERAL